MKLPLSLVTLAVTSALVILLNPAPLHAQSSMIVLNDGRALEGRVESVGQDSLSWWLVGLPQAQTLKYDQIKYVEFAQPQDWVNVMTLFENGQFAAAAEILKNISLQRNSATFYPAPGNFATLAERRLLDCYRRLRMPSEIAYISKRIEWNKLPPSEREVASIIDCWSAVGNGEWEVAQAAYEKARKAQADTDPAAAELGYLNGLIAIGMENPAEAAVQFGRAYGPDASADGAMAADSLKLAIQQIQSDVERMDELRALIRLYSELHGNGKLWEGADDFLIKLLAEANANAQKPAP